MLIALLLALQVLDVKTVTTTRLPDAQVIQTDAEVFLIEDGRVTVKSAEETRVLSSKEDTWSCASPVSFRGLQRRLLL